MSRLKNIIKKFIPKKMYQKYAARKQLRITARQKEEYAQKEVHYGSQHQDKTFYVIRRPIGAGLFSDVHYVLGHCIYAKEHGYIPVVDMQNNVNFYKEKKAIDGVNNAWEYYFEQPGGYTLNDIRKANKVILSEGTIRMQQYDHSFQFVLDNDMSKIMAYHEAFEQFVRVKPCAYEKIEKLKEELFGDNIILGVQYRGTDYQTTQPKGHQRQPSIEQTIAKIEELSAAWHYDKIFFMSEEKKAIDAMKEQFGDKVLLYDKQLIQNYDGVTTTAAWKFDRKNDKYLSGMEYVTETLLLSKCHYVICGAVNGAVAAIEINGNKYIDKFVFNLGIFE